MVWSVLLAERTEVMVKLLIQFSSVRLSVICRKCIVAKR